MPYNSAAERNFEKIYFYTKIGNFAFLSLLWGLRGNARCSF